MNKSIHGITVSRGGTSMSHLLFADDCLLFCKASLFEWLHLQDILLLYEQASGQKLNREKTYIFFSHNTREEAKEHILAVAGVNST